MYFLLYKGYDEKLNAKVGRNDEGRNSTVVAVKGTA